MGTSLTATTTSATAAGDFSLQPGKLWPSFEQLRIDGGAGVSAGVREGQVGVLSIKGVEFVILRRKDFDRVYGLAQDVRRLAKGIPLLRQAAEFVLRGGGDELAVRHFQELTLTFPDIVTAGAPVLGDLSLEVNEAGGSGQELSVGSYVPPRAATRAAETGEPTGV
jgi:hypothetical protein